MDIEKLQPHFDIVNTFKIRSTSSRCNVSGVKEIKEYGVLKRKKKIGHPIKSQSFGLNRKFIDQDLTPAVNNVKHPHIYKALQEIAKIIDPNFSYVSITCNKNLEALPHRDKRNNGVSMCIAFGDFTGGGLYVEQEDGSFKLLDIHNKVHYFNGAKQTHYTEPFEGERWSLIYY